VAVRAGAEGRGLARGALPWECGAHLVELIKDKEETHMELLDVYGPCRAHVLNAFK
jgi:hypothetical protein